MKTDLGSKLALYPSTMVVAGTMVDGKPNWITIAHVGIIGTDRIMISSDQRHYTNRGIRATGAVSVNLVSEAMVDAANRAGSVSGADEDKSGLFEYSVGKTGAPIIDASPLSMDCTVDDIYEARGFDNFVLKIESTYVDESAVNPNGTIDYGKVSPLLFAAGSPYLTVGPAVGKKD